jgi:hypothetical protein
MYLPSFQQLSPVLRWDRQSDTVELPGRILGKLLQKSDSAKAADLRQRVGEPRTAIARETFADVLAGALCARYVDDAWYRVQYPDVDKAIIGGSASAAATHFYLVGFLEGRMPRHFAVDETWYRQRYADIAAAMAAGKLQSPAAHYNANGFFEGRIPRPELAEEITEWNQLIEQCALAEPVEREKPLQTPAAGAASLKRILAVGFSHLTSIEDAQRIRIRIGRAAYTIDFVYPWPTSRYDPWIRHEQGETIYNPVLQDDLLALSRQHEYAAIIGSLTDNMYFNLGVTNDPVPFDFVEPDGDAEGLTAGARVLPYGMVRAFLLERLQQRMGLLPIIRSTGAQPFYMLALPPLIGDDEKLKAGTSSEELDRIIHQRGLPPKSFRRKLWSLAQSLLQELSESYGAKFVPVPAEAVDTEGFLSYEYWRSNNDAFHANQRYGELVLTQMDHLLGIDQGD